MFSASGNKGFSITFENGNTVSVQWGPSNYCDPTCDEGRDAAHDAPQKSDAWKSETAEVAAWDKDGNWHNCGGDQVKGWLSPAEVVEFINFAANNKLDIRPCWSEDEDEDEDEDDARAAADEMLSAAESMGLGTDKDLNSDDASNYAAPV